MEVFTDQEIKEIESSEDLKDMLNILDSILDGETFKIRTTETDKTLDKTYKPILPKGLEEATDAKVLKNKSVYAYILNILIALLIDLNPSTVDNENYYAFRIATIVNIIVSGCVLKTDNWLYADVEFNKEFLKKEGKKYANKHADIINKVKGYLNASSTFLAFSCMNMVRFNHHFPIEKLNLIHKSLTGLGEELRDDLLNENKLETFYNQFVTAARLLNDKKYYEKYILKKKDESNKYFYYSVLGAYNVEYEDEIIKIRTTNTPNGFLICDIISEILNDLRNKQLLFIFPYLNQFLDILKIRNHIRLNPFAYHPSKYFYNCKAADYDAIIEKFQSTMKIIGSFVYQYSETMYESVRDAKCRNKYEKNITKADEVLIKSMLEITKIDITLPKEKVDMVKRKLYKPIYEFDDDTDLNKLNTDIEERIKKELNEN